MKRFYSIIICCLIFNILTGQIKDRVWTKSLNKEALELKSLEFNEYTSGDLYSLNLDALNSVIINAPKRSSFNKSSNVVVKFPNDEGEFERFKILETSTFDEELQIKFPNIKSYVGKGLDETGSRIRFSVSPFGLNAVLYKLDGRIINIKPYNLKNNTYSVSREDLKSFEAVQCGLDALNSNFNKFSKKEGTSLKNANDGILRTFRTAISTTSEYSLDVLVDLGVDLNAEEHVKKTAVLSQINNIVTFLNEVYERDIGITFQLVANNDQIIFFDTATDGLPHADKFAVRDANQVVQDNIIGSENYDIGHVFDYGGDGGVATIATVCVDGEKAKGASEINSLYYRNLVVAHEIGHQFGANHTFNKCSLPMVQSATTVEPGSGTTIMSYAGGCGSNNVDVKGEYFHYINILEMWANISTGNSTCAIQTTTGNAPPVVSSLPNYTLPISTHFALTADVSDANNDDLTFTWEQIDPELTVSPPVDTATEGPSFRSFPPASSPTRYFPNLETIHAGNISNTWEVVPSVSRTMNFAVTVRDNNVEVGQTASETTTITFDDTSGPFVMTNPSVSEIWAIDDSKTINWDVANTTNNPVNCSHVNILLSIDGGITYPIILVSNTLNDGSEEITVPDNPSLHGRIKVEAVNNIFFDVSPEIEISIDGNPTTTAIPDSNFELELRISGLDTDGVENGKVFTRDIENTTILNISNKSISDITGIEDFISLTELDCSVNFITSLDLSSNLFLEELICSTNSITQLNITQNVNLKSLLCNSNQLTSLDVTNNVLLEDLKSYSNPLTSLDVTNNLELVTLHCYYNTLTNLDVTNNALLDDLRCYSNSLTGIDTSQNSSLRNFWCWSNLITDIDISQNLLLTSFACNNNLISTLDLSLNDKLVFVLCDSNQLENLNIKNGNNSNIASLNASNNPSLYCIEVDNSADANAGIGYYSTWVKDSYSTYYENCGITDIPDANFEQYLIDSGIDEDGIVNQKVITLDVVDEFYITLPANADISDITGIEDFNNLYGLSISFNTIPIIDVSNNPNLNYIDAQDSGLTSLDISNNTLLATLGISGNLIEELDLSNNSNLTFVNVSSNQLKKLDISLNNNVTRLFCANNNLEYLNAQNGNNSNFLFFDAINNPNLYCIKVDDVDYSIANWLNKDEQSSYSTNCDVAISPKLFLQGAMLNPNTGEETFMRDDLRVLGFIPTTSPYVDGLTCDASVFVTAGVDAIVDWVLIEIRDKTENTKIVSSQSALLQRDGDIVATDGVSFLKFWLRSDDYFLTAKHRNHLGVMSASAIALSESTTVVNFTDDSVPTYGTHAQTNFSMPGGTFALWSGDADNNGNISFANDGNQTLFDVLFHPNNVTYSSSYTLASGYYNSDINLDGTVSFQNDLNTILTHVLFYPANTTYNSSYSLFDEQLPSSSSSKMASQIQFEAHQTYIQTKINKIK